LVLVFGVELELDNFVRSSLMRDIVKDIEKAKNIYNRQQQTTTEMPIGEYLDAV
jgi:hypothetical protein